MSSSASIKITSVQVKQNKLIAKIEVSPAIERYFLDDTFVAEYNTNIEDVPESILSIAPLGAVLTVAWAVGADIYVNKLDQTYLHAVEQVKQQFRQWYPQLSYSTTIYVNESVASQFNNKGHGLLFSSGVDSLFSYTRLKDKKPTLISIGGGDIPYQADLFWGKVSKWLLNFASNEKLPIRLIKVNVREIINRKYLQSRFSIESWWGNISHVLIFMGLCAPLTIKEIGSITIAASHTSDFRHPWGSHPLIDPKICWADVNVIHDGYDFSRQDKINYLAKEHPTYLKYLRVCYSQHKVYNCGHCEKCFRTITGLLLANQDPRKCNFKINTDILRLIKKYFSNRVLPLSESDIFMWSDIQKHIPAQVQDGEYGQKSFFSWFKEVDLAKYRGNRLKAKVFLVSYLLRNKSLSDWLRHGRRKIKEMLKGCAVAYKK